MSGPRPGALSAVASLLRTDPVLPTLLGSADATVAVALPAQAVLVAALANFTERTPIVVVTATGVDADRVADDLACLLPRRDDEGGPGVTTVGAVGGSVAVLPAWETLPFERVSPEVETMGRRLALLWGLRHPVDDPIFAPPRVIVAPVRALLQRLGPTPPDGAADRASRPGALGRRAPRPASSGPATGASTRSSTGERSPYAVGSSMCSHRPPTCRCASTSGATRWTA